MNFTDLKLPTEYLQQNAVNTFTYRDKSGTNHDITVKEYLPVEDKIDLIAIALQKAEEDGIYNELLLDVYFHLNIIYLYTNIEFSDEDRLNELELYDKLDTNGIINDVIANMNQNEYNNLKDYLTVMKESHLKYDNTAAAVLQRMIQDLPKNAAAAAEIVNNFNPEQYQAVADFATAANGGRNIKTNMAPVQPPAAQQEQVKKIPPKKIVKINTATKKD